MFSGMHACKKLQIKKDLLAIIRFGWFDWRINLLNFLISFESN